MSTTPYQFQDATVSDNSTIIVKDDGVKIGRGAGAYRSRRGMRGCLSLWFKALLLVLVLLGSLGSTLYLYEKRLEDSSALARQSHYVVQDQKAKGKLEPGAKGGKDGKGGKGVQGKGKNAKEGKKVTTTGPTTTTVPASTTGKNVLTRPPILALAIFIARVIHISKLGRLHTILRITIDIEMGRSYFSLHVLLLFSNLIISVLNL
eukprot:g46809.t1